MSDQFTETTHTGLLSHLGASVKGVFFGILLIIGGITLLWTNEGRAVKTARALEEGSENVISIQPDKIDVANNNKLVHVSGLATTIDTITDVDFNVRVNALKLTRIAQHYQWKEKSVSKTEKNLGGSTDTETTYSYTQGWENSPIESDKFKIPAGHQNLNPYSYNDESIFAETITLGAFALPENLAKRISSSKKISIPSLDTNLSKIAVIASDYIYIGSKNVGSPQIGDLRISFTAVYPKQISIVAKQFDNTFEEYIASNGNNVELLQEGTVSAERMFNNAIESNTTKTWLMRLLGFLLLFVGLRGIFKPLVAVVNIVPFLGSILSMGLGVVCFAMAFPLSVIIIATAWLAYRPMLAAILIAIGVGLFIVLKQRSKLKIQAS